MFHHKIHIYVSLIHVESFSFFECDGLMMRMKNIQYDDDLYTLLLSLSLSHSLSRPRPKTPKNDWHSSMERTNWNLDIKQKFYIYSIISVIKLLRFNKQREFIMIIWSLKLDELEI